ncbi:peroxisomal biogenesis factor 11 [Multifurca ochricompacta]|uniref:Peroxisomal biogenesis factor 11 n=1 Tax=Multifurca ochricompacta TaxID=376703 RepID=A0AAD4MCV8_9AGAM|nr:peroxisomal biogenesis factor 11 [Multifurca ochricompacta]
MANVASQIILHPTSSAILKVLGTTLGRDKVYRATQYFARFLAWYLISRGHKAEAVRWNVLKGHLAIARKLLRLGKPLEHLQAALRAAQTTGYVKEQLATIARQLAYFGYLTYDTVVWANTIRFITLKSETSQKVQKIANRFWLAGILFSITHAVFKAGRLTKETRKARRLDEKNVGEENARESRLRGLHAMRADTRRQFIIDIFDVWLPASNLGLVNVNDGVLGIFGFISSVLALQAQWLTVNSK